MSATVDNATATSVAFDVAELKAALVTLKPAVGRSGFPELSCILVEARDSNDRQPPRASLTATDLELVLTVQARPLSAETGKMLVPFAELANALKVWKSGTVTIHSDGKRVCVANRRRSIELAAVTPERFPSSRTVRGREVSLNLDAIADVLPAAAKDPTRPILASVAVDHGAYVTSDSYRLSIVETATGTGETFLVPYAAAAVAAKFHGTVEAVVDEHVIKITLDPSTCLTARLVEGAYPQWRTLIPAEPKPIVEFDGTLTSELKAMLALKVGEAEHGVRLRPLACGFELLIGDPDSAAARTTVPGSVALPTGVGFNPRYLLSVLDGTTSTTLLGTDALKPAMIVEPAPQFGAGAMRRRLIMPVRVS